MDKYSFHHHLRGVYAPSKRTRECVRFTVPKYPLFADKTHRLLKDTIFGSSGTFPLGCFGTSGLGGNNNPFYQKNIPHDSRYTQIKRYITFIRLWFEPLYF